ncbi:phosphoethanolamine transferase [Xaviernesmea oryzae]|uniref:Phosphoethanolamine transferase n=1 Tax=Xaviernesmea oryzae TaxID=464029 RepID=A0A1Q9AY22_9HYPH|nr:phosphoethanolamine--lipid A transferase [Xaviernesmea oryzae]OLP60319.1 phosphoethanolamine transferase [Xaviernesmea oryzae]SEK23503.1 lipid A ethanolaminephosphotransferase [Xaviernesmea oryzae]
MKPSFWKTRPQVGSFTLCAMTTAYLLLVANHAFWTRAAADFKDDHLALGLFATGVTASALALLTLFSAKYITKPVLILFVLTASAASWFTDQFGVVIDREMIRNMMQSTSAETGHLITPRFVLHLALTGLLPSALILWVRIVHRPILSKLLHNTAIITGCLLVLAGSAVSDYKTIAGVSRAHHEIMDPLTPFYAMTSAVRYGVDAMRGPRGAPAPLGADAHRPAGPKPRVTVIIAGETARAEDFSLGGYPVETNPEMKKRGVVYFPQTTSCGTSTAVSLPCMFSNLTRKGYSHDKALERENLLDVLGHAKVAVSWLDNDTGSYKVSDRVPYEFLPKSADPRFCSGGECLDGILLDRMDRWLDQIKGDSVLVLHQLGSHGPAYFARYPEEFRRFKPDCRAEDFGKCTPQEIRNAYDNTILYTDHVVAQVIDKLAARETSLAASVIYLSDHGESLGENGLYLHGAPYLIAPSQQTHVPFLTWIAPDVQKANGFDMACLQASATSPTSHDNLFHSVLGLMDIATTAYEPGLDVFAGCRGEGKVAETVTKGPKLLN